MIFLILTLYISVEVVFIYLTVHYKRKLEKKYIPHDHESSDTVAKNILEYIKKDEHTDEFIKCIYEYTPISSEQLYHFFAYHIYERKVNNHKWNEENITPERKKVLQEIVAHLKKSSPHLINDDVYHQKTILYSDKKQRFNVTYKPLLFYFFISLIHFMFDIFFFRMRGYTRHYEPKYNMYIWTSKKDESKDTLLFTHGLGLGIIPYARYILGIEKQYNIVLPILPNISLYSYHLDFYSLSDIASSIISLLNKSKVKKFHCAGHSLGTSVIDIIVIARPERVLKSIYYEPVCFIIHQGAVAKNSLRHSCLT